MGKILLLFFILIGNFVKGAKHFNFKSFDSVNYDSSVSKGEATNDYIKFYQNYISDIRGHECPMYPSCSNFGIKTFTDKGFFSAMALTSDRLMRCGHDHNLYSLTFLIINFQEKTFFTVKTIIILHILIITLWTPIPYLFKI